MEIVFWLDAVPQVCKGLFNAVANKWDGRSYYVISGDISPERKLINSQMGCGNAEIVYLFQEGDYIEKGMRFLREHKDAYHVFNGYRSKNAVFLDCLIKERSPATKIIIWAERPLPRWKQMFPMSLYHSYYALRYGKAVDAFLPLGSKGVKEYRRLGWKKEKLFPLLYLPIMNERLPKHEGGAPKKIRFVYLGRFSASKGALVLKEAADELSDLDFTVDLIGGYGPDKDLIIEWCGSHKRAAFKGTWPLDEACQRLHAYDVCVVPSLYDGWNVTVNEALMAGIGCIVTDEAVSDELITASGAGLVVKAGSRDALVKAMKSVISEPSLAESWKDRAFEFRGRMCAERCAEYFISVLNYISNPNAERPRAPWLS